MKSFLKKTTTTLILSLGLAATANAGEVLVASDISTSTTWTANNTYNLDGQIYVLPGATLTIEAGTVIASDTGAGGSLAVCRGAQIFALGTAARPIIMTSKADVATWKGTSLSPFVPGDPKTGSWREGNNEWGNLTLMGEGFISENAAGLGNLPTCDAGNEADMEGLNSSTSTDRYGGGDNDDDSGVLQFVSTRYTGRVLGLGNELNGLSLGGIGRETDIHHIDIMNNVDDGIEIWGGAVNIKFANIWNIGDDSFDVDQGWTGKAQFILIVQGYSTRTAQGSGTGDNCFEVDGAEQSDYQPVTTTTIYNATVIGQPVSGDHGTAWRDNARVQYRNCIFMNLGERLVSFDNIDGDGGAGYGFGGTLSWASTWTTDYNAVPAHANDCPPGFYQAQSSGKLAEIKDSVFWSNLNGAAYTEATARGAYPGNGTNNNVDSGSLGTNMPIQKIVRGPNVSYSGLTMRPVILLDPRPANAALTSVATAPNDGFFTQAAYRGAFSPNKGPWIASWTAADAYGFLFSHIKGATPPPAPAGPATF